MNVNNLIQGQTIKNYKELCTILEVKPKTSGNSKVAQIKEMERYFNYHKEGNKFVIDEIYTNPLPKIDNRGAENIYKDNIKAIILYLLLKHDINKKVDHWKFNKEYGIINNYNNRYIVSKSYLMKCCGMFGNFYYTYLGRKKQLAEALGVKQLYVNDAYNYDFKTNSSVLDRALKQLSNERIIQVNNLYLFKTCRETNNMIAEDKQIDYFLKAENTVLKEMGIKNIAIVYLCRKEVEFNKRVLDYLNELICNDEIFCFEDELISYSRALDIRYVDDILLESLQEQLQHNYTTNQQDLKEKILHSLENTFNKVNQKSKDIQNKKGYDYLRSKDDYVTIVMEVIKIITDINASTTKTLPKLDHLITYNNNIISFKKGLQNKKTKPKEIEIIEDEETEDVYNNLSDDEYWELYSEIENNNNVPF